MAAFLSKAKAGVSALASKAGVSIPGTGGGGAAQLEKLFKKLHTNIVGEYRARIGGTAFDSTAANAEEVALCEAIFPKYESGGALVQAQCKNLARDYVASAREHVPAIVHDLFELMFDHQIASFRAQGADAASLADLQSQKEGAIKQACDNLESQLAAFGDTDAQLDNTALVLLQSLDANSDGRVDRDEFKDRFLAFVRGLIPQA
eukprot:Amastigsp_a340255_353.p2 type:complete len:205 gc:universal Amastigsp_a340255_353:33-647(+)